MSPTVLFSEDGVMENKSLEGIAQHYTLPRIVLANVVLAPAYLLPHESSDKSMLSQEDKI